MQDNSRKMEVSLVGLVRLFPIITEIRQISRENNIPLRKLIGLIAKCAEDLNDLSPVDQILDPKIQSTKLLEGLMVRIENLKKALAAEDSDIPMEILVQIDDFADIYYGTSKMLDRAFRESSSFREAYKSTPGDDFNVPPDEDDEDSDLDCDEDWEEDWEEDNENYDEDEYDEDDADYPEDEYILQLKIDIPGTECPYEFICEGYTWDEAALNLVNLIQILTEDFAL